MQILYGVRITDRVKIEPCLPRGFMVFFDGEPIGTADTGEEGARLALAYLRARAEKRQLDTAEAARRDALNQEIVDDHFLRTFADRIGCSDSDMFELIEVIKRRIK